MKQKTKVAKENEMALCYLVRVSECSMWFLPLLLFVLQDLSRDLEYDVAIRSINTCNNKKKQKNITFT